MEQGATPEQLDAEEREAAREPYVNPDPPPIPQYDEWE
jgi:hypothetical protein